MLPVSALVHDENMAESTESLRDGGVYRASHRDGSQSGSHWRNVEDQIVLLFATGCKREDCKSFAPYLLRSVNRS